MSVLPQSTRDHIIRTALRKKFGWVLDWETPILWHDIGPSKPNVYDDFIEGRSVLVTVAKDALDQLSDQEIMEVGAPSGAQANDTHKWWEQFLSEEVRALRKNLPSDLLFGLGHPDHKADIAYWPQMPHFTLREVALLSVGVDPERFDDADLFGMEKDESDQTYPSVRFFFEAAAPAKALLSS